MNTKQKTKRAGGWLVVIGVLVVLTVLVTLNVANWDGTTAEWSQAIIQGLAAVGGVSYALNRSRPRVTLHLGSVRKSQDP
ncbi:MAG: hypothetical protein OXH67_14370 [Acidimicrobiaceae bacterium]|nr:hypothetical protein [Acidimicrobiaceae bacterium]